jgi:hypothetical protein
MVEVTLLRPDPKIAKLDAEIGRALANGLGGIVFKRSPIPDFLKDKTEEAGMSAANCARYEMYLKRLSKVGADPVQMRARITNGVRRLHVVGQMG